MTIRYFRRVEERINKSAWLIEQKSVFTEYDEDADVGFIGGRVQFKNGSVFHFKEILLRENRHYRFHYMDEGNNPISRWDSAASQGIENLSLSCPFAGWREGM